MRILYIILIVHNFINQFVYKLELNYIFVKNTIKMTKKKKAKRGVKLKYGVSTMTSSLRHPKCKEQYVKDTLNVLKEEFETEFKTNKK